MQDHIDGDESCIITAQRVLSIAQRARELFLSSNFDEKQQILNFVFSNLKLDAGNLHVELLEPFATMQKMATQLEWLGLLVTLRTFDWRAFKQKLALQIKQIPQISVHLRTTNFCCSTC